MINYFKNTTQCIEKYNQVLDVIANYSRETTDEEDEFLQNFCLHFAHALIKDYPGVRDEICKVADIINDVCR